MKHKSLIPLFSLIGVTTPTICLVSCGDEPIPPQPEETAENYIFNRTFSLIAYGDWKLDPTRYSVVWGTAWILSDATPNTTSDYEYYIATNWHVVDGLDGLIEDVVEGTYKVCYGCNKKSSGLIIPNDYTQFISYEPIDDETKFTYDGNKKHAIDFYIAKVNFGSSPSTSIKPHLDALNDLQTEKGYITKTPKTTSTQKFNNTPTYMGGYPVRNNQYATWGFKKIAANTLEYVDYREDYHDIDDYGNIVDISPNYQYNSRFVSPDWMPGGASGSMLIAPIGDEWQVIGIYWGGWNPTLYPNQFHPCFSLFNTNYKDFTQI